MVLRVLVTSATVALALAAGCASRGETQQELYVSTPLAFDPTEHYELATWWSNGDQLLYLGADGYYAIHDDGNRYRPPAERGKWWKHSYAALWLEPYDTPSHETRRVSISKTAGTLALTVGPSAPFAALAGPPAVLEDRLVGRWRGEPGRLELRADMRYVFQPSQVLPQTPAAVTRQQGRWALSGAALVLEPDSPRARPLTLSLLERGESLVLHTEGGELRRES